MKKYITLILVLFSVSLFSQTRLDTLIFNEITRVTGNKELKMDSVVYDEANTQVKYLFKKSDASKIVLSHNRDGRRLKGMAEILAGGNGFNGSSEEELAKSIVNLWINSPEHKKIMFMKKWKFIGVSTIVISKKKVSVRDKSSAKLKLKTTDCYELISVVVFSTN